MPLRCFPGVSGSDFEWRAYLACIAQNFLVRGAQAASLLAAAACRSPSSYIFRTMKNDCFRQAAGNCRLVVCAPQKYRTVSPPCFG
jgi:hypothetical protein